MITHNFQVLRTDFPERNILSDAGVVGCGDVHPSPQNSNFFLQFFVLRLRNINKRITLWLDNNTRGLPACP